MKKAIALSIIFTYSSLTLLGPGASWAAEKSAQPVENIELNPDYQIPKKDQEFARRSEVGRKWTFKEIPRDLGLSMKESFWGWGALGFAAGAGLTAALLPVDNDVNNAWSQNAIFGQKGNDVLKWVFSPYTYGGVSLILWVVGHNTRHHKLGLTGRALTEALFLSLAISTIAKFAIRRQRPDGGNFSFPSNHATAAFAAAGVLTVFYGWKGALPGYAVATIVSLNRLDSQAHWLTDVVGGAVLGTVIGIGTARFFKKGSS